MKKINFKKVMLAAMSTVPLATPAFMAISCGGGSSKPDVGVVVYKASDPFIATIMDQIKKSASTLGFSEMDADGNNDPSAQLNMIDTLISKGVKALAINPVKPQNVQDIIGKAKAQNIPLVLWNKEAAAGNDGKDLAARNTTMASYDKVWYVGTTAEDQGNQQAVQIYNDIKNHYLKDNNGDGKLGYFILRGEAGHPDAIARSTAVRQHFIELFKDETKFPAIKLVKADNSDSVTIDKTNAANIFNDLAAGTETWLDWTAAKGLETTNSIMAKHKAEVEAIISNNDDMASGAVQYLKENHYSPLFTAGGKPEDYAKSTTITNHISVYGVDGTPVGLGALKDGWLNATILNDGKSQGILISTILDDILHSKPIKASYEIDNPYETGKKETINMVAEPKAFYVESQTITSENLSKFQ